MVPAHNPLDVPVVIDEEGRQLAGGAWALVPDTDEVRDAEAAQRLVLFPGGLPDDADPAILEAVYGSTDASPADPDDELDGDLEPSPSPSTAAAKKATGSRKATR